MQVVDVVLDRRRPGNVRVGRFGGVAPVTVLLAASAGSGGIDFEPGDVFVVLLIGFGPVKAALV